MSTIPIPVSNALETEAPIETVTPVVAVKRRTIDVILVGAGVLATLVLVVAAVLLTWGAQFADDYVGDELSSQRIAFPPAEALEGQGRDDLVQYAGQPVDTGKEAEAYASYIDGHLQDIAGGATYAELGATQSAANAEVTTAIDSGASQSQIDELQASSDEITAQRDSLFKGETLRGLLLTAYAWSTVGMIAGIAAIAAFIAAALMAILVVLGLLHLRHTSRATPALEGSSG